MTSDKSPDLPWKQRPTMAAVLYFGDHLLIIVGEVLVL